jgi:hypothetical protein
VNKQLAEAQETEDAVSQASLEQIKSLREQIKSLEAEKVDLVNRIHLMQQANAPKPVRENLNDIFNSNGSSAVSHTTNVTNISSNGSLNGELIVNKDHLKNMKLLEVFNFCNLILLFWI